MLASQPLPSDFCAAPDTAVLSTPDKRNVHQVSAGGDAGCAFLDVLTPPYDWECVTAALCSCAAPLG